ncbi:MAG: PAS domain S-box protein [bacterium]|nr:PAS domain S-box protein [bacterium]
MGKKFTYEELEKKVADLEVRLEEQQQATEKFSRAFFSSPLMMIITVAKTGRIIEVNDSFCINMGYRREELTGRTTLELNLWVHPEKRKEFVKMIDDPDPVKTMEVEVRKKNGEVFIGLVSFDGFVLNGEKYILATINDITKQKKAEESLYESEHRYRSLVQLLPVAMLVHCEGKIVFINDEGIKLLHGSSHADFIGKPILDFVHPDYHDVGRKRIKDIYDKKRDAEYIEEKFIRLDGVVIDVEAAARIVDYKAKPASQTVIKDITERKLLAEELQKTQKLESVGILAGGIAHDFNNILTAIMGNISLALLKTDPEQQLYPLLQSAEKASLRARELTQQLLTFSKGGEPIKENASIEELIRESGAFILRGSNVSCSYIFAPGLLPVEVDKGQISQVIQNLILNADQAMPGGGVIEVKAENVSLKNRQVALLKKGKYIKISIKDRGIGIEEKLLQKIFDPYFSTKKKGSGLGLAIVYSIVRKHNGAVTVESALGEGTVVNIYLPAAEEKERITRLVPVKSPVIKGEGFILIMDDDPQVRMTGELMVESMGYRATCVEDGVEALKVYKKEKATGRTFDVVIMDLTVPGGMGGKKAVKELLLFDPGAKVVVSSGYSNDPVMAKYKKYGFCGVLPKPIVLEDLNKLLTRLSHNKS